jgi:small-conductance mechanosensitive channel
LFGYLGHSARKKFPHINFKQAGSFLGTAFFWLIIFSSILVITDILELTVLTNWFQSIIHYVPNILAAILIVFTAIILGNLVSDTLLSVGKRTGIKYSTTLVRIIRFVLLLLAIVIALDQIGIEIALLINIIDIVLAALLFGAALAFGLGARTSISNILACYYIRKRYKVGDEIQVGKTRGIIIKIDTTNIVMDNEIGQVTIPAKLFNETKSYLIKKD